MNNKYLVLLFFFLLIDHNTPQSVFNGVVTVENQLLQKNNLTTQDLTLSGIVTVNNNLENNTLTFAGNNITILGLTTEYLLTKAFSLNSDGTLFKTPFNEIKKTFFINDTFASLYTNIVSPLDQNILSINTLKNDIEIGVLLNIRDITFNSNDITLNAQNIDTTNINHVITINDDLKIKTNLTASSIGINKTNSINELEATTLTINNTANIATNDITMSTKESLIGRMQCSKIEILGKNITFQQNIPLDLSIVENENFSDIVLLGLNNENELIQFPNFYFTQVIINSLSGKLITLNIKKSIHNTIIGSFGGTPGIAFYSLGSFDSSDLGSTFQIKKKITMDNIRLFNSNVSPIQIKSTTIATTLDTNTSTTANPSFKTTNITNLTIQNNFTMNGAINFNGHNNLNNLPITNGDIKIVADRNQGWLIGTEPGSSASFKENIRDFQLSKEEFLATIEPIFRESKGEFFVSLDPEKIENSSLCSLATEYNSQGEPIYYDHRAILAIAASQIPHLKEEISNYEELSRHIEKETAALKNAQIENEKEFQQSKEEIIQLLKTFHSRYSKKTE